MRKLHLDQHSLRSLVISDSKVKDFGNLQDISHNFSELQLSKCTSIQHDLLQAVLQNATNLSRLHLKQCRGTFLSYPLPPSSLVDWI
jgi:hypothetical protein